jgi:UPF0271 protein
VSLDNSNIPPPDTASMTIDVNCDLGESFGNWRLGDDEGIMPLVTTANIACGFHAGDPVVMAHTVKLVKEHRVAPGAHPGYPDLLGFGRRQYKLSPEEAAAYVRYQVGALLGFLQAEGLTLSHVKPHGALFNFLKSDESVAADVADAVAGFGPDVKFYFPAPMTDLPLAQELRARGVRVVGEIYPDLSYSPEGDLIIQRNIRQTNVEFAAAQVRQFIEEGTVAAEDRTPVPLEAESICIHGDGPNAIEVAKAVRGAVQAAGWRVEALA